jgi:hypothetical protein
VIIANYEQCAQLSKADNNKFCLGVKKKHKYLFSRNRRMERFVCVNANRFQRRRMRKCTLRGQLTETAFQNLYIVIEIKYKCCIFYEYN